MVADQYGESGSNADCIKIVTVLAAGCWLLAAGCWLLTVCIGFMDQLFACNANPACSRSGWK